jgi:hypothetical protein
MPSPTRRILAVTLRVLAVLSLLIPAAISAPVTIPAQEEFDFTINESFLKRLDQDNTLLQSLQIRMGDHSSVHPIGQDCEMHIGGTFQDVNPGRPAPVVIEPPSLCQFNPPGSGSWPSVIDSKVKDKTCTVVGFFRIFTGHARPIIIYYVELSLQGIEQ